MHLRVALERVGRVATHDDQIGRSAACAAHESQRASNVGERIRRRIAPEFRRHCHAGRAVSQLGDDLVRVAVQAFDRAVEQTLARHPFFAPADQQDRVR